MEREKQREPKRTAASDAERAHIPLPADTLVDTELLEVYHRQIRTMADEAYDDFVQRGGLKHLPGLGKPLVIPTGDVLDSILKKSGAAPPWVMLRQATKKEIEEVIQLLEKNPQQPLIDELIVLINEKIEELNHQAPSLALHRAKVSRATIQERYKQWV
ncbi:DnaJ family domain-containing protein [Paenibacillus thalictri]|nr:DnaJ family domain-containing protein [Paenibacillus thalictri]